MESLLGLSAQEGQLESESGEAASGIRIHIFGTLPCSKVGKKDEKKVQVSQDLQENQVSIFIYFLGR